MSELRALRNRNKIKDESTELMRGREGIEEVSGRNIKL